MLLHDKRISSKYKKVFFDRITGRCTIVINQFVVIIEFNAKSTYILNIFLKNLCVYCYNYNLLTINQVCQNTSINLLTKFKKYFKSCVYLTSMNVEQSFSTYRHIFLTLHMVDTVTCDNCEAYLMFFIFLKKQILTNVFLDKCIIHLRITTTYITCTKQYNYYYNGPIFYKLNKIEYLSFCCANLLILF